MKKPKILIYDIETSPNLAYVWGKYEQDVIAYESEWELLSFSCKWLGEKNVEFYGRNTMSEKQLCKKLHAKLSEADVIVAHNGDQFDQKKARARFIVHGLEPLKPLVTIDTKKVAKANFSFNSNSLNDLGKTLGLGQKAQTGGFALWQGCMSGDKKSWKKMQQYNQQDVKLLEKVYNKMLPWTKHPNMSLLQGYHGCPNCSSKKVIKKGIRANHQGLMQQMQCKDCTSWFLVGMKKANLYNK